MSLYNRIIDQQKLRLAWQHVKRNHPAEGVDGMSWEQFDENQKEELYRLHTELKEKQYEPLPVREITLYKGDKARNIALFSMRDKVVHQSVACELEKIYEAKFSEHSYAYRQGKSALDAVALIEKAVGDYDWALKMDIQNFFDSIQQKRLIGIMGSSIRENDVIDLMKLVMKTKALDLKSGQLISRSDGVYQGSSLAPIWSNIYLMEFDQPIEVNGICYVRYSDDILLLAKEREELEKIEHNARNYLGNIGLKLSEQKRELVNIKDGYTYLGYYFDKDGKSITKKAEESLKEKLETMWLASVNRTTEEKLAIGS